MKMISQFARLEISLAKKRDMRDIYMSLNVI